VARAIAKVVHMSTCFQAGLAPPDLSEPAAQVCPRRD